MIAFPSSVSVNVYFDDSAIVELEMCSDIMNVRLHIFQFRLFLAAMAELYD